VAQPAITQPTRRLLGRYALHGEIAAGGMAAVHLGRLLGPVGFARTVAIKRLHPQFAKDPAFVAMFLDEARLASRIRHPNVVPTLDVVSIDDEIFLVMEYVHGESLAKLIKSSNARDELVPVEIAVSILVQALHGLHAAHEATSERGKPLQIVHRDVSPHNLLVGIDGVTSVLDFGIAKATSRMQVTQDGQLKGKLAYMAPEQIEHAEVDRRVDVYAAAAVLWEVLTGRRLFVEGNPARLMKQVLDSELMPPRELIPGIPQEVEDIVMKGLARRPDDRFATARDMAIALEETGLAASQRTIGAWVERTARDALRERATKVADVEADSDIAQPAPPPAPPKPQPNDPISRIGPAADPEAGSLLITNVTTVWDDPRRKRRRLQLAIVGAIAVLGLSAIGVVSMRSENEPVSVTVPALASPTGTAAGPATASVSAPAPATATATATATTSATTSAGAPPTGPKVVKAKPKPKPAKPDCNPPYTTDAQGIKVPKLQCL
jgi:serine/threonine protein kinase